MGANHQRAALAARVAKTDAPGKWAVGLAALVSAGMFAGHVPAQDSAAAGAGPEAVPVETTSVRRGAIRDEVILTGYVEPRAEVNLFSRIPGRVRSLLVDEGDSVALGEPLATMDEATTLALAVRQAETQVRAAEITLGAAETMAQVKLAGQLQQANAGVESAQAALAQAEDLSHTRLDSQIRQAEAGLDALRANMAKIVDGARGQEREQVQAGLDQAAANLQRAQAEYDRMKGLFEQEVITRQAFEGVETQYRLAKAQHEIARQQVDLVEEGARDEDIEALEAQMRQADAGLAILNRMNETRSWEKDILQARSRVSQAEATLEVTQTAWDTEGWNVEIGLAQTQVDGARTALALAEEKLGHATVRSPMDGIVAKRHADVGDNALSALPGARGLFEIIDIDVVYATVTASESDIGMIRVGQTVEARTRAQDASITGTVSFVSPVVDARTHMGEVKVEVENADHSIRPGMFVEVTVASRFAADALLVPRAAIANLQGDTGEAYVVLDGHAAKRSVRLGVTDGAVVEVLEGLSENDQLITAGQSLLHDSAPVHVLATN